MSALSWRSDISWFAADSVISSGTPSFGGRTIRHSAPTAEKPKPERPLISAEAARITTNKAIVVGVSPSMNSTATLSKRDGNQPHAETGPTAGGRDSAGDLATAGRQSAP